MNAKILGAFLLAMTASGCIVVSGGGGGNPPPTPPKPGNVTFTWTFNGANCADVPYVKNLHVTIPGETLQNGGIYPCLANNYPGIELHDFAGGSYTFTIEAVDYSDHVVFSKAGSFVVDGNTGVTVDLDTVGQAVTYAYVRWFFPPVSPTIQNPTCAQVYVKTVDMYVDDQLVDHFPCADGQTADGVPTNYMGPGTHSIVLIGYDFEGYELYRKVSSFVTTSGAVGQDFTFDWAVGGAAVGWQLTNGIQQNCAQAKVSFVYVNFKDSAGNFVYAGAGDKQNCDASPALYNYLHPDTYQVFLQGPTTDGSGAIYLSNAAAPLVVNVVAGQFKDVNGAPIVTMTRQ